MPVFNYPPGTGSGGSTTIVAREPGGRLTLTSGTPVTTSNVTGATSIYFTPVIHDQIALWTGSAWSDITFPETTLALGTLTSGKNYDVFGFLSSGALALESLVWTNDTTRATAITYQGGRLCKSGDKTRLYLGSFRTTATTTTEDSATKRFLYNAYNRRRRTVKVVDTTSQWIYTVNSYRPANNSTANRVEILSGLAEDPIELLVMCFTYNSGAYNAVVGIGVDSTTATSAGLRMSDTNINGGGCAFAEYKANPTPGYHYYQWLENSQANGITQWFGTAGADSQAGLQGICSA